MARLRQTHDTLNEALEAINNRDRPKRVHQAKVVRAPRAPSYLDLVGEKPKGEIKEDGRRYYMKDGIEYVCGDPGEEDKQVCKWFVGDVYRAPDGAAGYFPLSVPPKTYEQVLEERLAEIEREAVAQAKRDKKTEACRSCRFLLSRDRDRKGPWVCSQPLVAGIADRDKMPIVIHYGGKLGSYGLPDQLCTDERLLWEPRKTWWMKLVDWIYGEPSC